MMNPLPTTKVREDPVNHPPHYCSHPSGVECIQVAETMSFCLGNAFKYLFRCGEKDHALQDLEKALWYLRREKSLPERLTGRLWRCLWVLFRRPDKEVRWAVVRVLIDEHRYCHHMAQALKHIHLASVLFHSDYALNQAILEVVAMIALERNFQDSKINPA
jgi:hypothetical protein